MSNIFKHRCKFSRVSNEVTSWLGWIMMTGVTRSSFLFVAAASSSAAAAAAESAARASKPSTCTKRNRATPMSRPTSAKLATATANGTTIKGQATLRLRAPFVRE